MIFDKSWKEDIRSKNIHLLRSTDHNLDRPSYPRRLQKLIPALIAELFSKTQKFQTKYKWLSYPDTKVKYIGSTISYENDLYGMNGFKSMYLGRYILEEGIWSWAWVDRKNEFVNTQDSVTIRDYGFRNKYETLTKTHWFAKPDEVLEVIAICAQLKSAIAIEVLDLGEFHHFHLILEKLD